MNIEELLHKIYSHKKFEHYFPISINFHQGSYLRKLINQLKPKTIIELGCGHGVSTLWIQSASHTPKQHHTVDPTVQSKQLAGHAYFKTNHQIITNLTSQQYLAMLDKKKHSADFIFMDADERFDGCMTDCYFAFRVLEQNGHLVIRNLWNPSVRNVCKFLIMNLPVRPIGLPTWYTRLIAHSPAPVLGTLLYFSTKMYSAEFLILKKIATDQRNWNHFIKFYLTIFTVFNFELLYT